jgi:phosphate starvation-inducible PhoH-like protein
MPLGSIMPKTRNFDEDHALEIEFADENIVRKLSGIEHETLKTIAKTFNIRVGARGHQINLRGDKKSIKSAGDLIKHLGELIKEGRAISLGDVRNAALRLRAETKSRPKDFLSDSLIRLKSGRDVSARGPGQRSYVTAIEKNDLVLAVGPAGTGKTFLAMTLAVMALNAKQISRIILTRPAVEAGEKLGFLPGSLEEKVLPYLSPWSN